MFLTDQSSPAMTATIPVIPMCAIPSTLGLRRGRRGGRCRPCRVYSLLLLVIAPLRRRLAVALRVEVGTALVRRLVQLNLDAVLLA
jgi:hypothetical protein